MKNIAVKEKYSDGQVIIKEGSFGEGTYVVLSGTVEIIKKVGDEKITIAALGKGDIFGEMSFIDRESRSASVVASGDVEVGLIDKDFLEFEINKTSSDFRTIITALTARLKKTTFELVQLKAEYHVCMKK
jgi:CRP/FNR family transcriptional regulator